MVASQTDRWSRVARGTLLAAFSVFVAAMSHLIAGGHAPAVLATTLALVFAVPASIFAVGTRATLARVIVAVALSQALFHLLFSVGGSGSAVITEVGHHGGSVVISGTSPAHGEDAAMWIAHGVAALVTIVAVRMVQRSIRRAGFAPRIRFVEPMLVALVPAPSAPPVRSEFIGPTRLSLQHRVDATPHRGPPVAFA